MSYGVWEIFFSKMACNGFGKHCFVYLNPARYIKTRCICDRSWGESAEKNTHPTINAERLHFIREIKTVKNVHNLNLLN